MKTVTILLTRYKNLFGRFICTICGNGYSHASVSIDEAEEIFYSFNDKGFVIEKPKKYFPKTRAKGSACIRMQVPDETYELIEEEIQHFIRHREQYKYSRLGVALCLLHIPYKFKNRYFCSRFVAEVLSEAGAVELKKKPSLYLPNHFIDEIECLFSQRQVIYNAI